MDRRTDRRTNGQTDGETDKPQLLRITAWLLRVKLVCICQTYRKNGTFYGFIADSACMFVVCNWISAHLAAKWHGWVEYVVLCHRHVVSLCCFVTVSRQYRPPSVRNGLFLFLTLALYVVESCPISGVSIIYIGRWNQGWGTRYLDTLRGDMIGNVMLCYVIND